MSAKEVKYYFDLEILVKNKIFVKLHEIFYDKISLLLFYKDENSTHQKRVFYNVNAP